MTSDQLDQFEKLINMIPGLRGKILEHAMSEEHRKSIEAWAAKFDSQQRLIGELSSELNQVRFALLDAGVPTTDENHVLSVSQRIRQLYAMWQREASENMGRMCADKYPLECALQNKENELKKAKEEVQRLRERADTMECNAKKWRSDAEAKGKALVELNHSLRALTKASETYPC